MKVDHPWQSETITGEFPASMETSDMDYENTVTVTAAPAGPTNNVAPFTVSHSGRSNFINEKSTPIPVRVAGGKYK